MNAKSEIESVNNLPIDDVLRLIYHSEQNAAIQILNEHVGQWSDNELVLIWGSVFRYDATDVFVHLTRSRMGNGVEMLQCFSQAQRAFFSPAYEMLLHAADQDVFEKARSFIDNYDIRNACVVLAIAQSRGEDITSFRMSEERENKWMQATAIQWMGSDHPDFITRQPYTVFHAWLSSRQDCVEKLKNIWNDNLQKKYSEPYMGDHERQRLQDANAHFNKTLLLSSLDDSMLNGRASAKKNKI